MTSSRMVLSSCMNGSYLPAGGLQNKLKMIHQFKISSGGNKLSAHTQKGSIAKHHRKLYQKAHLLKTLEDSAVAKARIAGRPRCYRWWWCARSTTS